jgi:hypothetical protein
MFRLDKINVSDQIQNDQFQSLDMMVLYQKSQDLSNSICLIL